jgi:predicted esterase YcpF (UPF0227 family)
MIIYIHGFGGSGAGHKAELFREYFMLRGIPYIAPSLPTNPSLAMQTLSELIEAFDDVSLIGSSLGGYYAIYLCEKYNLKTVLINPSINPQITLNKSIHSAMNFYDMCRFEWTQSHLNILNGYKTQVGNQDNILLLSQKGDELLDYKEAVEFLPYTKQIVQDGGDHSFVGIESMFTQIEEFLLK